MTYQVIILKYMHHSSIFLKRMTQVDCLKIRRVLNIALKLTLVIHLNSNYRLISIPRSCEDYFYKLELPEVKINLLFGFFELIKSVPTTMIRFEKAVLIETDYLQMSKRIYRSSPVHVYVT